jgi:mono/diheme cytochrome c family protein
VKRLAPVLVAIVGLGAAAFDPSLPAFGARVAELPAGPGREIAARACLTCHSSDILRQQRLTEAQWAASVKKMTGWGAPVSDDEIETLVKYLASHFGPDNDRFQPTVTRPIGR